MSLDNIQLSPAMLQNLYKDSLINLVPGEKSKEKLQNPSIPSLGKNAKKITIITHTAGTAFLGDAELNLLINMLSACKLTLEDIALVNSFDNGEVIYENILATFSPSVVIFFGIKPSELGFPLEFPAYQVQRYNGMSLLASVPLEQLASDVNEKKYLWKSLQLL
ncbi:MAG: hypothetical protein ABIT96_07065, partial [Ferruginibacter sp.]